MMNARSQRSVSYKQNLIQSQKIWNKMASWWDDRVKDGDLFHKTFIYPAVLKLSDVSKSDKILDIACGNGALTRLLANTKAQITAVDFSENLIQCARARSMKYTNIKFAVADATNKMALRRLAKRERFDVIICSMALQDMCLIKPLIASLKYLIASHGRFIFSIPHPCFNSCFTKFDLLSHPSSMVINNYIACRQFKVQAKPGQPFAHLAFHRPLSHICYLLFQEKFVLTGLVEPLIGKKKLPKDFLWAHFKNIPPAIVMRWTMADDIVK